MCKQRQQNIGIYSTQLKRLHQTSEISSIYIHGETNNGVCKLRMGPHNTGKRLATLKKYKKEQQDSFSTITQTEHLAVLLKW